MTPTNELILDHFMTLPSEIIVTVRFVNPTVEMDNTLEKTILLKDIHEDHIHYLNLHRKALSMPFNQIPLIILTFFQKKNSKSKEEIEFKMYTTGMTKAVTPTNWFYKMFFL